MFHRSSFATYEFLFKSVSARRGSGRFSVSQQYASRENRCTRVVNSLATIALRISVVFFIAIFSASNIVAQNTEERADFAQEFRLGIIQSLTGQDAETGERVRRAIELAVSELSTEDFHIRLFVEDDRSDPAQALQAFKRLTNERVQAVVGATWSETTKAIVPLATQARIPLLNTTLFPESLTASPYVFAVSLASAELIRPAEEYLDSTRPKSVVIVKSRDRWGEAQQKSVSELLATRKIAIAGTFDAPQESPTAWTELVARIKKTKADTVFVLLKRADAVQFLHEARTSHLKSGVFGSYPFFDVWRDQSERVYLNGSCFSYPFEQLEREQDFVKRFQARFGEEPLIFADASYDAVSLLKAGAQSAVAAPLHEVLKTVTLDGIAGQYQFSPKLQFSIGSSSLVCIVNKAPIVLRGKIRKYLK